MDLQLFPHIEFRLSLRDNSDFHSLKCKVESHSGLNSSRVLISFDDGSFQNHIFFAAAYLASTGASGEFFLNLGWQSDDEHCSDDN